MLLPDCRDAVDVDVEVDVPEAPEAFVAVPDADAEESPFAVPEAVTVAKPDDAVPVAAVPLSPLGEDAAAAAVLTATAVTPSSPVVVAPELLPVPLPPLPDPLPSSVDVAVVVGVVSAPPAVVASLVAVAEAAVDGRMVGKLEVALTSMQLRS